MKKATKGIPLIDIKQALNSSLSSNFPSFHLFERPVHVVGDSLDLQLLVDQLVLNLVDPEIQWIYVLGDKQL